MSEEMVAAPNTSTSLTVDECVERIDRYSREKGWREEFYNWQKFGSEGWRIQAALIVEKLALITTEVAEAIEEVRSAKSLEDLQRRWYGENGKPEGFGAELADIHIRTWDLEAMLGVDSTLSLEEKIEYNDTREYKHGGRTL